jgi:hypothetical protein
MNLIVKGSDYSLIKVGKIQKDNKKLRDLNGKKMLYLSFLWREGGICLGRAPLQGAQWLACGISVERAWNLLITIASVLLVAFKSGWIPGRLEFLKYS